jgi:isocitrate/isopropylmalate dehydrogenase
LASKALSITSVARDGIGKEVVPEGLGVLPAAARRLYIPMTFVDDK